MKTIFILSSLIFMAAQVASAEETVAHKTSESDALSSARSFSREKFFSYETDDQTAVESLNRVAGEIDLGFTIRKESDYKSSTQQQTPTNLLSREKYPSDSYLNSKQ